MKKNFGSLNVTASGAKEAIVFSTQYFFQVQFKYMPEAQIIYGWQQLMTWMIAQKPLDFTPRISSPTVFYDCTLESTNEDGKGLAYKIMEMLPNFPGVYDLGLMKFRLRSALNVSS